MRALATAACLLVLAGCGKSADSGGDSALAAPAAKAAAANGAAGSLAAYQNSVTALVAGAYSGQCNGIEGVATPGKFSIGADGAVVADQWQGNLAGDADQLSLLRQLGAAPAFSFHASGAAKPWQIVMSSSNGGSVMYGEGTTGRQCRGVAQTAALESKPLYPAVAAFFRAAATDLTCVADGQVQTRAFKPDADGLSLGPLRINFAGAVTREAIIVDRRGSSLQYNADYADGNKIIMIVEDGGKLQSATATSPQGKVIMCSPPEK